MKKRKAKPTDYFDWDGFFKNAKFEEVMDLQFRERRRWISCFSPCRRWFFLASQDIDIDTKEVDAGFVRPLIDSIKQDIDRRMKKRTGDDHCLKTMRITSLLIDKSFLESLLCDLTDDSFYI